MKSEMVQRFILFKSFYSNLEMKPLDFWFS